MITLWDMDRADDAAKGLAAGYPICIGCGWSCDDAELDLCCDCFDAAVMQQMRRGDFGRDEQREARASSRVHA